MTIIPIDEVILTARCRLRYPSKADFPHIWSASRVPGFNDGMRWDPPTDIAELEEPLQKNHEAWANGSAYAWTVESRDSAAFIGRISIRHEAAPGNGQ